MRQIISHHKTVCPTSDLGRWTTYIHLCYCYCCCCVHHINRSGPNHSHKQKKHCTWLQIRFVVCWTGKQFEENKTLVYNFNELWLLWISIFIHNNFPFEVRTPFRSVCFFVWNRSSSERSSIRNPFGTLCLSIPLFCFIWDDRWLTRWWKHRRLHSAVKKGRSAERFYLPGVWGRTAEPVWLSI